MSSVCLSSSIKENVSYLCYLKQHLIHTRVKKLYKQKLMCEWVNGVMQRKIAFIKIIQAGGWQDGSLVKGTCHSSPVT